MRRQCASQLNGSNGEWTNGDDMPKKNKGILMRQGKSKRGKTRAQKKADAKREAKRMTRALIREPVISLASAYVGEGLARGGYRLGAKTIKAATAREKSLVLSSAAAKYLKSYLKPFDQEVRNVGIPTTPSYPTYKVMGFIRGTGYIGTQGVGFVALCPVMANDAAAVYYTTAAYAQNMAAQPASDVGTLTGGPNIPAVSLFTNLPYTAAQLTSTTANNKIEGRMVSASLRAQYSGTELNRSGMIYAYADPDGDNTLGGPHINAAAGSGYTIDSISTKEATEIYPVKKGFTQLVVLPPNSSCLDFTNQNASAVRQVSPYASGEVITLNGNSQGPASCLLMFTGVAGQSFYFEAVVHVEYEGAGVTQSLLTESHADVVGLDAVQNILSRAQRKCAGDPQLTFNSSINKIMRDEKVVFGVGKRSVDY